MAGGTRATRLLEMGQLCKINPMMRWMLVLLMLVAGGKAGCGGIATTGEERAGGVGGICATACWSVIFTASLTLAVRW